MKYLFGDLCVALFSLGLLKCLAVLVRCGVLTFEIEHVDVATLERLEQQGVDCQPKASTVRIIQVYNPSCLTSNRVENKLL